MNKKEQMRFMRSEGATYREISQAVGCSYQYVAQILGESDETKFRPFTAKDCVYPGLRSWLNTNKCSKRELYRKMYGYNMIGHSNVMLSDRLHGKVPFRMDEINLIISITDLTYEQLFLDKLSQDSSQDKQERNCNTCYARDMEPEEIDNPCWNCKGDGFQNWKQKEDRTK